MQVLSHWSFPRPLGLSNCEQNVGRPGVYTTPMGTNGTLLCIHRDPAQLRPLQADGYNLVTATNGSDGLQLFMSQSVDAVVLEYHLGLLDGSVVAAEIKQLRPGVPIVMLVDHLELPDGALKSVDALVVKSDGMHFLWATVHFILNVKVGRGHEREMRAEAPAQLRRGRRASRTRGGRPAPRPGTDQNDAPR